MSESWGGEERRRVSEDHDLLIEIHTLLKGMKENHAAHIVDDDKNFARLYSRTGTLQKYLWMGLGALGALEFALHYIKK